MQQIQARIRLLMLYLLVSLPLIVYGAIRALEASNNSPVDWVDERFSERKVYDHFSEQFGPGDAVIISWPECWWTDPVRNLWNGGSLVYGGCGADRHSLFD
ncbi:MAG: hypothetical protein ACKON9_04770, partial [Planctomycetaceae bacterium]